MLIVNRGSKSCHLHVMTPNRPLVFSGNDSLVFAPYHTHYPQLELHMRHVGLQPSPNNWDQPFYVGTSRRNDFNNHHLWSYDHMALYKLDSCSYYFFSPSVLNFFFFFFFFLLLLLLLLCEGVQKLNEKYMKSRYDLQSVLSAASKLSCKRTALKRCTNIEILLYRKLVSLASPEFREILLPRSLRRWRADALNMPKVSTANVSRM